MRASWAALRATISTPSLTRSASIPSSLQTEMISSIAPCMPRCSAITESRPWVLAIWSRLPAKWSETQPPLRPDAPNPANSRSRTTISASGRARDM